jgi:hypothetical protein
VSSDKVDLVKKLSEIQRSIKAPKSQFNKFGKYAYRNCEDILEAIKPLMGDLAVTLNDQPKVLDGRHYIEATASITNGCETISTTSLAREPEEKKGMDASQITGTASSYARKYALSGLFMIDDNKDADNMDNSGGPAKAPAMVIDDNARSWIDTIKADPSAASQLQDGEYKNFIMKNVNGV